MAVVLPRGALFRMAAEGKIREKLLGMDILDAVIGLGQNLFYGTGLAACILVIRQKKPKDHRKKVLIVDASKEFKKGRAQNELLPDLVDRIYQWYSATFANRCKSFRYTGSGPCSTRGSNNNRS
jgi:type I restriction enzyme M protein